MENDVLYTHKKTQPQYKKEDKHSSMYSTPYTLPFNSISRFLYHDSIIIFHIAHGKKSNLSFRPEKEC